MKYRALLVGSFALSLIPLACGSGDGDNSGAGGQVINLFQGGSTSSGGSGNPGGGNNGTGAFNGGTKVLTPAELDEFRKAKCAEQASEAEAQPGALELVVDVSSSMKDPAPGTNRSKWEVTRDALLEAVPGVNGGGLPGAIQVGVLFYPNVEAKIQTTQGGPPTNCVATDKMIAIQPLGNANGAHRQLLSTSIRNAQLLRSTPTNDAFTWALDNGISKVGGGLKRHMLLITDGTPTLSKGCFNQSGELNAVDAEPIVQEIARAAKLGIKTFLIGSPGSEDNRAWMSRAAVIGGTAPAGCNVKGPEWCHMDLTTSSDFSASLKAGLAAVTGALKQCEYPVNPPADGVLDPMKINVLVESGNQSTLLLRDDMGDCSEGWQIVGDKVRLCGDSCDKANADANATISVIYGCGSSMGEVPK